MESTVSGAKEINPYGVVRAFDESFPTENQLQRNEEMEAYLINYCNVYETVEGQRKRLRVIDKLGSIIAKWAKGVAAQKKIPDGSIGEHGGIQLRIFGSTRLGVHNPDSDIDMLCIAPDYISKADFFCSFVKVLSERIDVESVCAIPEAYTPVVKFNIDRQSVDMIFVALRVPTVSRDIDILDLNYLLGLNEQSVRSLNGARVAEWILRLVPNADTFCAALRVVKYWSRVRGVYSNVLGFLGGVNYAILVALICQLYPKACPFTLVKSFFEVMAGWRWPTPVMIRSYEDLQLKDSDGRPLPVWNPKLNYKDSMHLMPIVTPAYPAMNSAYNVAYPQFRYIQEELLRARQIYQAYDYYGGTGPFPWSALCELATVDFFKKCPRYIQVDISSDSTVDHRNWFGWVESRLRLLIVSLEQPPVTFCHPMASCFHRQVRAQTYSLTSKDSLLQGGTTSTLAPSVASDTIKEHHNQNKIASSTGIASTPRKDSITSESSSSLPGLALSAMSVQAGKVKSTSGSSGSGSSSSSNSNKDSQTNSDMHNTEDNAAENKKQKTSSSASPIAEADNNGNKTGGESTDEFATPTRHRTLSVSHPSATQDRRTTNEMNEETGEISSRSRNLSTESVASSLVQDHIRFISSFFIGLSFQKGLQYADVTPAVQEFQFKVNMWKDKKEGMELNISSIDNSSVPSFVYAVKAEPSDIKSCTPKPKHTRARSRSSSSATPGRGNKPFFDDDDDEEEKNRLASLTAGAAVSTATVTGAAGVVGLVQATKRENASNGGNNQAGVRVISLEDSSPGGTIRQKTEAVPTSTHSSAVLGTSSPRGTTTAAAAVAPAPASPIERQLFPSNAKHVGVPDTLVVTTSVSPAARATAAVPTPDSRIPKSLAPPVTMTALGTQTALPIEVGAPEVPAPPHVRLTEGILKSALHLDNHQTGLSSGGIQSNPPANHHQHQPHAVAFISKVQSADSSSAHSETGSNDDENEEHNFKYSGDPLPYYHFNTNIISPSSAYQREDSQFAIAMNSYEGGIGSVGSSAEFDYEALHPSPAAPAAATTLPPPPSQQYQIQMQQQQQQQKQQQQQQMLALRSLSQAPLMTTINHTPHRHAPSLLQAQVQPQQQQQQQSIYSGIQYPVQSVPSYQSQQHYHAQPSHQPRQQEQQYQFHYQQQQYAQQQQQHLPQQYQPLHHQQQQQAQHRVLVGGGGTGGRPVVRRRSDPHSWQPQYPNRSNNVADGPSGNSTSSVQTAGGQMSSVRGPHAEPPKVISWAGRLGGGGTVNGGGGPGGIDGGHTNNSNMNNNIGHGRNTPGTAISASNGNQRRHVPRSNSASIADSMPRPGDNYTSNNNKNSGNYSNNNNNNNNNNSNNNPNNKKVQQQAGSNTGTSSSGTAESTMPATTTTTTSNVTHHTHKRSNKNKHKHGGAGGSSPATPQSTGSSGSSPKATTNSYNISSSSSNNFSGGSAVHAVSSGNGSGRTSGEKVNSSEGGSGPGVAAQHSPQKKMKQQQQQQQPSQQQS